MQIFILNIWNRAKKITEVYSLEKYVSTENPTSLFEDRSQYWLFRKYCVSGRVGCVGGDVTRRLSRNFVAFFSFLIQSTVELDSFSIILFGRQFS